MSGEIINVQTPSSGGSESISNDYLLSLSKRLNHNIFPIKLITKNGNLLKPGDLQLNNFHSELYLRNDKFMTIIVPDTWSGNSSMSIYIFDNYGDRLCTLEEGVDYNYFYFQEEDRYMNVVQLRMHDEIDPQEITIVIIYEVE